MAKASLVVHAAQKSPYPVPRFLTGKFCEHLYFNVTNGMDAQILKNPTFSDYPFSTGQTSPDGVATFHYSREEIARAIRGEAERWGWPKSDIDGLVKSRNEAVACWWAKLGDVQASPDTGPYGGRAQRIATRASGQGLMQWTWLPLHRIRKYNVQLWVRSPDLGTLTVAFFGPDGKYPRETRDSTYHGRMAGIQRDARNPRRTAGGYRLPLRHHGRPAGSVCDQSRAVAPSRPCQSGRSRCDSLLERLPAADSPLAGRQFRQHVSLARRRRPARTAPDLAELRLGTAGEQLLRHRRVHRVLPGRRLRADDLHQCRQWHARRGRPVDRVLQRRCPDPDGQAPGGPRESGTL